MPRGILLIAGLTVLSAVSGQGQTANQSTATTPVNGPFGGPILVTPSAGFPNPAPTAGISDAGRAGISNASNGAETTTAPSTPATIVTTPATVSPSETTEQAPAGDMAASTFVGGPSDASAPATIGVAEVSSRYKAERGTRNARVLGNEDVQSMLSNKNGVTLAKNMPPLDRGALEQGGQARNAGAQGGAPPVATQPSQQNTEANASASQPGQSGASSQATAPSGQNQTGADAQAENSTTPQINQNQQSNDAQGSRRLPATATFLPLLGLLGLVSGGIGFWFRKFRN